MWQYVSKDNSIAEAETAYSAFTESIEQEEYSEAYAYLSDNFQDALSVEGLEGSMETPPRSEIQAEGVTYIIKSKKS